MELNFSNAEMSVGDRASGGKLIVGALAGEQRPCAALSPAFVGAAVLPLAVAVVVVAPPAGAEGRVALEDGVDDLERVDDERVVGAADAVADKFEEACIDNLAGLEVLLLVRGAVGDMDVAGSDLVVVEGLAGSRRADPHVVVLDVGIEDAFGGGGPLVEMGFDPVGVAFEKGCEFVGLLGAGDVRRADEAGDDGGEGRRRVAGGLFPALLLGDRGVADQEGGGAFDQREDVEVAETIRPSTDATRG